MVPGASRLVVGHTPQRGGCNSACDGAVWRVDVGLSRGVFGAGAQVLEIDGDRVRVLGVATGPRGAAAVAIAAAEEEARSRTGEEAGGGDSEEAGEEEGEAEKKAAV